MSDPAKIRDLMDACRPNMSDECLPEMQTLADELERDAGLRDVFAVSQEFDRHVSDAFHDVDVPVGLQDRLLNALANDEIVASTSDSAEIAEPVEPRPASTPKLSRRRWMWVAGAVTAASVTAGLVLYNGWQRDFTVDEVCELTPEWLHELDQDAWQQSGAKQAGESMPKGLRHRDWQWQEASTPLGRTLVLYDGGGSYLMIASAKASSTLKKAPPPRPANATGPYRIGVWGKDRFVYVLAVAGGTREYQSLIRLSQVFA